MVMGWSDVFVCGNVVVVALMIIKGWQDVVFHGVL